MREIRCYGAGMFSNARCADCCGYGVLALNGGPSWIPCTTCVWPGLTTEQAIERERTSAVSDDA